MFNTSPPRQKALSELERQVMDAVWRNAPATAETVREQLPRPLKDSTIRTILRRLEEKGFVQHEVEGRTYFYRATGAPQQVAANAVRQIIDRFCGGSVEELLVGLVDHEVLDSRQLEKLAKRISDRRSKR